MNWSQTVQSNQSSHQYQIRQTSRGQAPSPQQPPYRSSNTQQSTYRQQYDTSRYHPRSQPPSHSTHPPSHSNQSLSPQTKSPPNNAVNKASVSPSDSSNMNAVDTEPPVPQENEARVSAATAEQLQQQTKQASAASTDHKAVSNDNEHTENKDTDIMDTDGATLEHKSDDNPNDVEQQSMGTTPKKKPFSSSNSVNSKMFFGTRYEVKCDETFAYYEGYVYDYDEEEKKLRVSYPWKEDQSVAVNYVRPLAPAVDPNWKPKQGDHVECQAKAEESEPYGWWDCIIKTVRDNLYLITYEGWDNHHEVLQHNMLRPYNDQESFEDDGIIREFLTISRDRINEFKSTGDLSSMKMDQFGVEHASNFTSTQRTISQLRRIAQETQLIHLNYSPSREKLILIGKKQNVYDAKMLIKFVWDLRELYRKKEEAVKNEEKSRCAEYEELKTCVRIKFDFPIALTKYVIGTKGENILSAKNIAGVKHINVRNLDCDTSECLILATDHAAADEARDILEMQQDFELIPAVVRKELIGKDGSNIKRLEERSQVIKICTLDHLKYIRDSNRNYYNQNNYAPNYYNQYGAEEEENSEHSDPNLVKLIIIGPKEKVPFAKMLIKSEVASIEQKRKFIERQQRAKQEINSIHNGTGNKYADEEWIERQQHNNYGGSGYNGYDPAAANRGYEAQQSPSQSMRRQRLKRRDRTEQSSKNTAEFNYMQKTRVTQNNADVNANNAGADYPALGAPDGGDAAQVNEANQNEISWLEHDAEGIAEDEEAAEQNELERQQQLQQRQRYETSARRYRGKGQGQRGGASNANRAKRGQNQQQQRSSYQPAKPRWKPKGAQNQ